jgi:hypothetical protein
MDYGSFVCALILEKIVAVDLNKKHNDQVLVSGKIKGISGFNSNSLRIFYLGNHPK